MNYDSLCSDVDCHLTCSVGDSVEVVSDLEFLLKEEDFLWVKIANFKPQCKPVKYKPLSKKAIKKTEIIAKTVSKYYENGYGKYFNFFDDLYKQFIL